MGIYEPLISLALALCVGLLIGIQREQSAQADGRREPEFLGGVRTHPLFALLGALATLLAGQWGWWLPAAVFAVVGALLALAYADDLRQQRDRGLTSEAAFLLTFLLGVLAMSDKVLPEAGTRWLATAALGVCITTLLSLKEPLHGLVAKLSRDDIYASLKFLVLAVIVLPLLPNASYGPLQALNPFEIGLMIVLIAGLSFAGYVAIRVLGPGRGMGLTGLLGGIVSSTAVTLSFAGRAKRDPQAAGVCALAVVLACSVMLVRVHVLTAATYPELLPDVALPFGAMLGTNLLGALVLYRRGQTTRAEPEQLKFHNPFELGVAVKFGLLFALVLLGTKAASTYLGQTGLFVAALISGLTDMDAITISSARLAAQGTGHKVAVTAMLLGAGANTLVKIGLALALGGWAFGRRVLFVLLAVLAAGGAGLAALWFA